MSAGRLPTSSPSPACEEPRGPKSSSREEHRPEAAAGGDPQPGRRAGADLGRQCPARPVDRQCGRPRLARRRRPRIRIAVYDTPPAAVPRRRRTRRWRRATASCRTTMADVVRTWPSRPAWGAQLDDCKTDSDVAGPRLCGGFAPGRDHPHHREREVRAASALKTMSTLVQGVQRASRHRRGEGSGGAGRQPDGARRSVRTPRGFRPRGI